MRRLIRWFKGRSKKLPSDVHSESGTSDSPAEAVQREYIEAASANPKSIQVALTALAAVGAALLVGLSFSDLSKASDTDRRIALTAAVVGLVAVLLAIFVGYLAHIKSDYGFLETSTRKSVRRHLRRNTTVFNGLYSDVDSLRVDYVNELALFAKAWHSRRLKFDDELAAESYRVADERLALLDEQVATVTSSIAFFLTKRRTQRLGYLMFGSAIVAAAALVVFIAKTNPSASDQVVVSPRPTSVMVSLTDAGLDVLRRQAGDTCSSRELSGVALSKPRDDEVEVVTVATAASAPARLTVTPSLGFVESDG